MKIDAIDAFYLAMPKVTEEADGSQDALVVRVAAGGHTGWGECEASPLASIAALVCRCRTAPAAGRPVGARRAAGRTGRHRADRRAGSITNSMDLLQAPHTFSGIEMALWDLLGKARSEPVWRLLGYRQCLREIALCLAAFRRRAAGDPGTAARSRAAAGYRAMKFGWGPFGTRRARRRRRPADGGARGDRTGCNAAGRCRPDLRGGCGGRRAPAAGARGGRRIWLEEPFAGHALAAPMPRSPPPRRRSAWPAGRRPITS